MDDKNQEFGFTLEDILKEFGSQPAPSPDEEEPAQQADAPDAQAYAEPESQEPEPEQEQLCSDADFEYAVTPTADEPEPVDFYDDTVTDDDFEPLPAAPEVVQADTEHDPTAEEESAGTDPVLDEDTVRLDLDKIAAAVSSQKVTDEETVFFEPISDDISEQAASSIPEGAEPFSAGWEPEYEQPIGEYTPPEPIVFRPRSQLHALKRKLVAGPERRYYALMEKGIGKLQIAIFLNLLVVILGVASIGLYHFGLVQPNRMRLLVYGEIFCMLFSALLASNCLLNGFLSLIKGKFTLDTLLLATFLVCMADGYFCLKEIRVPFCAAFSLEACMALWAEYHRRNTEIGQMDTLRKATRLNRVAKAPGCSEDEPGFYVANGDLEDFMDNYQETGSFEKLVNLYGILALILSGAIAVMVGLSQGISTALQVWSAGLLAAMPATIFICQTRPMAILEQRLHKLGVVLCGWKGIKAATGTASIPLSDQDLLPGGSVKINGVKFYTNREPDQVIAYAAALIQQDGNCLSPLFEQLLDDRNGRHYDVTNFRGYECKGIGGEVCDESVLVGTIAFLQDMGVETPEGARVNQAVYMAINGELCAVFALAFGKLKGVSSGLGTLCSYRGLTPVLTCSNFLLSEGFIHAKFGVNTRRLAFPTAQQRKKVAAWTPNPAESTTCALTTQDTLASSAYAITGSRAVHTASMLGAVIHMFGGILGLLIVLVLTIVQADSLLTPSNLLLFELVWSIPGILITEWTRNI